MREHLAAIDNLSCRKVFNKFENGIISQVSYQALMVYIASYKCMLSTSNVSMEQNAVELETRKFQRHIEVGLISCQISVTICLSGFLFGIYVFFILNFFHYWY